MLEFGNGGFGKYSRVWRKMRRGKVTRSICRSEKKDWTGGGKDEKLKDGKVCIGNEEKGGRGG